MDLEELRGVQRAERQRDSLQHLRDSFYEDVAAYIAQLKDERRRAGEAADDPYASEDVRQLTDEIESAKEVANALYERRVGKVVKHASFAAADMATDEEGMTVEERELFEDLVARIRENRRAVLATLDGGAGSAAGTAAPADPATSDGPSTSDDPAVSGAVDAPAEEDPDTPSARGDGAEAAATTEPDDPPADPPDDGLLSDALGAADGSATSKSNSRSESESNSKSNPDPNVNRDIESTPDTGTARPADEARVAAGVADGSGGTDDGTSEASGTERTTLRITADVGTVYGVDEREYDLAREDVVTLPTTNAEPLLRKDAAERID
jgi:DNA replication factor GINS